MTDRIPSDVAEARLNHLIDRARRGALLPTEADQFTTGLHDLVRQLEDTEDDRDRVQQAACRTAENLRHVKGRIAELEAAIARVQDVVADMRGITGARFWADALDEAVAPQPITKESA